MKTMKKKMENNVRLASDWRYQGMKAIHSKVAEAQRQNPDELADEVVVALYRMNRDGEWLTVMVPLFGRMEADPENSVIREAAKIHLQERKGADGDWLDPNLDLTGLPDLDPEDCYLLGVAEISGARTMTAQVMHPETQEVIETGYSVNIFFADQSTVYFLVKDTGRLFYVISSQPLPTKGYFRGNPGDHYGKLLRENINSGNKAALGDLHLGGPLHELDNLYTVLTVPASDLNRFL